MMLSMIAAMGRNHVIGKDNDLVWDLPDDMAYFMKTTKGHAVIMGRKNYESIPDQYRPLSSRMNVVITRNPKYKIYECPGCHIVFSFEEALEQAKKHDDAETFVIGGGQIYEMGLPVANRLYLTEIDQDFEGDAFFPSFDKSQWKEVSRKHHPIDENHQYSFDFVIYDRI